MSKITVVHSENLAWLSTQKSEVVDMIYIDPPFNTGSVRSNSAMKDRGAPSAFYADSYDSYIDFLLPRMIEAHRVLKPGGSFFFHIDYREVHYCKVMLDSVFGRSSFMNEIIWAYDYGARTKIRWPAKHDNILWYAKDPQNYQFHYDMVERIPYMAPGLVGSEKAAIGKTLTDTWWHTIVPTNGKERVGYPTQKPLGIINRLVLVHSSPGDLLLDFFAGSGTLGVSAKIHGRDCILVDSSEAAIAISEKRIACD